MSEVNSIDKHVGARLRAMRDERGYSAEQVVRACGMSIDRLDRLENGRERMKVEEMRRLCEALGVTPADFFRGLNDGAESAQIAKDVSVEEEGRQLLADFRRIGDPGKRRTLLALAAAYAQESGH